MNFKKYQRRIPMNFKKIVPLTFAALSVAGALSACSDSAVVGADSQDNSVAIGSSSSVTPGSSGSLSASGLNFLSKETVAAFRNVSEGTALTYSHIAGETGFQTDSVTAHETFDRGVQSILDFDATVRNVDQTCIRPENYKMNYTTDVSMKDEDGLVYGDISFSQGSRSHECFIEHHLQVICGIENALSDDGTIVQVLGYGDYLKNYVGREENLTFYGNMYEVYFQSEKHPLYADSVAIKYMQTADSTIRDEFRKDCALENGELHDLAINFPGIVCLIKAERKNGIWTYKDPYWKKYAKFMIDGCVSSRNFDELYKRDEYLENVLREYYGEDYDILFRNDE